MVLRHAFPFLDNDLVDFAMSCPVALKLNNLEDVVRIDENDLREKGHAYFEKNKGWQADPSRCDGEVHSPGHCQCCQAGIFPRLMRVGSRVKASTLLGVCLFEGQPALFEILDPQPVRELVSAHFEGQQNRRLLIWSLLNVEQWLQDVFDSSDGALVTESNLRTNA